ncbi:inositol monophosphatase family protein [Daejeonella lutea]|uniref:Inositol-1-monophosphatase n=1 Tax=Daejeonella lutea TaxID=572036 RepID=A0A1T5ADQ6_9SPHI|nr:inositol monophosphatase family protein [Daejeonella lutea]SKB33035.1 myo-inositol-1(or 4)-monophosphatase [Daejeonella lutea]
MDLQALTKEVICLTKVVGEFIRGESKIFDRERIEYKGLHDMVSYVDKTAERDLVKGLTSILPEAGFITEEETSTVLSESYNWIIDPLDGTTNFIHGIPSFCISIALQYKAELVLGVVYEINRDECFSAWQNGGAYLNGMRISVSNAPAVENTLLATGFPFYEFSKMEKYLRVLRTLMQKCHGLRRIGSAALDLAYVACGRFDGYFEYNLNSYDIAAGMVLVREAGGQTFDFNGGNDCFERREIVATNGRISSELLESIKKEFN